MFLSPSPQPLSPYPPSPYPSGLVIHAIQALKAAFEELYPGAVDVDIVDLWTAHAPWPFNKFVEAYQFMAKRPPIWKAFWEYGRFPPTRRITDVRQTGIGTEAIDTV